MPAERPFVKPSSPVIKRLFDFSDPSETKKMLDEMLKLENDRLKYDWNFDSRAVYPAAITDENSGSLDVSIPKRRFSNWERQERCNVPHYYSRPLHPHRSESRCQDLCQHPSELDQKNPSEKEHFTNPKPLASRNGNSMKPYIRKRSVQKAALVFTSPPRISSGNLNSSLVQFVSALRVPLPSMETESPPAVVFVDNTSSREPHSKSVCDPLKNQASRQLFEGKSSLKRNHGPISSHQSKITGVCLLYRRLVMICMCDVAPVAFMSTIFYCNPLKKLIKCGVLCSKNRNSNFN